jgi:hypothetical protein
MASQQLLLKRNELHVKVRSRKSKWFLIKNFKIKFLLVNQFWMNYSRGGILNKMWINYIVRILRKSEFWEEIIRIFNFSIYFVVNFNDSSLFKGYLGKIGKERNNFYFFFLLVSGTFYISIKKLLTIKLKFNLKWFLALHNINKKKKKSFFQTNKKISFFISIPYFVQCKYSHFWIQLYYYTKNYITLISIY